MMMGSRGSGGAVVVGRLFRRMISTTADSTKNNIMVSPITTATTTTTTTTRRSFVSSTNIVLEKHTMKVPSMGDSITEVREEGNIYLFTLIRYTTGGFLSLCDIILLRGVFCILSTYLFIYLF
jgi:hypothetical protein